MYSSDMGYVPRKVGFHGHLLELCRGAICKPVKSLWPRNCSETQSLTDLRLLGCLHGFPRTRQVQVFEPCLYCALRDVDHGILRVGSWEICRCYWRSDTVTSAGIPPCRKKVASKCRPRATSNTVGLSLSCHGAHSRTQPTSKRRMGTS